MIGSSTKESAYHHSRKAFVLQVFSYIYLCFRDMQLFLDINVIAVAFK